MNQIFVALCLLITAASAALGHHSFSAEFDGKKIQTIKGSVVEFQWMNPHAYVYPPRSYHFRSNYFSFQRSYHPVRPEALSLIRGPGDGRVAAARQLRPRWAIHDSPLFFQSCTATFELAVYFRLVFG